jgi:NAD(P)-dependent dehydrogenase (short-subunit alcohol dehydrogenase family)
MRRILVLGATSAIAQAFARRAAEQGDRLCLVGRDPAKLDAVLADLKVRGAEDATSVAADLADSSGHEALLAQADLELGGFDTVLVAHAVLTDQALAQRDPSVLRRDLDANFTSAASLLTHAANLLEGRRRGTLAVISSVAGDRGRRSNYAYGAAKAALSTFTDGLRHRLVASGVNVLTIKPGLVDTPMTAHLPKGPLYASAEFVGRAIHRSLDRSGVLYLPSFWRLVMLVVRHLPEPIFLRTKL